MSDTVRVGSPQWDSRNQGFISPVRLQQFKATTPTHHFTSSTSINDKDDVDNVDIADDDAKDTMQNPQARPNPGNPANHSRSSSFFSFRKQANPSSASDIHNTPSLNGNAPGRRSVDQQQQPPPPQPQPQEPSSTSPKLPQAQAQSQSSPTQSQASQQGQLHPEIRSVVQLTAAHAHKVYVSGRLVRRVERDANGHRPTKDEGWTEVWAQLGGTTLSIWDMKAINEASKEGKEVPPTYINMTDAFVQVLGAITIPIPGSASERQENVLTLNTAGSNLLFFACPSTNALIAWASALRLSSWEKSRLEEIYTAHLIRITLSARDIPTTLTRGRLEGWVRVRIAGQTDWKSLWMVIAAAADDVPDELGRVASNTGSGAGPPGNTTGRIKRMSNLFSTKDNNNNNANIGPSFQRATVAMYPSPKPKDRKKAVLTLTDVTQAFAVYPERPELITRSTLIKLEGTMGAEDLAGGMRGREGWLLIMPQLEGNLSPAAEMLKWVIVDRSSNESRFEALHDAFKLYGRPQQWTWDPREPQSLMFAYPVGPHKDLLFLEREQAEKFDPREERTSVIRSRFVDIMAQKMQQSDPTQGGGQQRASTAPGSGRGYQLPPLSFDRTNNHDEDRHLLTPITERSSVYTHHGRSMSGDAASMLGPKPSLKGTINGAGVATGEAIPEEPRTPPVASGDDLLDRTGLTGGPISDSPRVSLDERAPPPPIKDGVGLGSTAPTRSPDSAYSPSSAVGGGRKSFDAVHNISSTNRSASPFGSPLRSPASGGKPSSLSNGGFEHKSPTPGSPSLSSLRSPHSPQPNTGGGGTVPERPVTPPGSILTSPYSPAPSVRQGSPTKSTFSFAAASQPFGSISRNSSTSASTMASVPSVPAPTPVATQPEDGGFHNEAGALYYMQQHGVGGGGSGGGSGLNGGPIAGRMPTTIAETDMDGDDGDDSSAEFSGPPVPAAAPGGAQGSSGPVLSAINASGRPSSASGQGTAVARQSTPMAFVERRGMNERSSTMGSVDSVYSTADSISASQSQSAPARQGVLGRKPSGARAQQVNSRMNLSGGNVVGSASPSSSPRLSQQPRRPAQVIEEEEMRDSTDGPTELAYASSSSPPRPARKESDVQTPATDDSSLDVLAALSYLDVTDPSQQQLGVERAGAGMTQPLKTNRASSTSPPPPASQPRALGAVKSSFAPSNKAAERKAKAQAQQAAAAAAASRPGRAANGKRKMRSAKADDGAWSSDEEEEEDEEEDEDEDNEEVDSDGEPASKPVSGANSSDNSIKPPQGGDDYFAQQATATHSRPPRNLPQIPTGRPGEADDLPPSRRPPVESQYSQQPMSQYYPQQPQMMSRNTMYEDNTPIRTQMEHPTPNHPRQHNMWSQVLDPGHHTGDAPSNTRDTFVQLESPAQTMTKAFTPQGLLSAGLHDKQGRSAKRQEELARESGASLINVPNKPPPPQTGLLGAITAHERERKRDGGVGAALTEREREKRLAEERQRRFDDAQRQQLDQMQQTGSMYGGQFGMNPMMMMNPMSMMGMNPMMTGGLSPMMTGGMTGGMNPMMSQYGMMGGYNPQHMFAAQQAAAQAYQQAMMAFSTAGSQVGGDGANGANNGGSPALNPMMTGNNMMGGMGMGGMGGMGFDPRMSMMMMNPMGMQNSGMSQFDPRMGPQNTGGSPSPLNDIPPSLLPPGGLGNNMPGSNSPARGGSPLARPTDSPRASRPTSPKPSQPVQ
ncbi:hypothetical protein V5O48_006981 [Marasmius crinis-equi]|uniref:PH domain-containing protein n=1 Tax=Marasmius crinis-equi TaxID=585013 RepID=A0ABR3FI33_9AGAR